MKLNKSQKNYLIFLAFMVFLGISFLLRFEPGVKMGHNFALFAKDMLLILPPAFILIGLFDVWVKRETVERHFGENSGPIGYFWAILLAATTVGGALVALPVANALYHKGARYAMVLTYVSAAALVMIPMTVFEATILGPAFSAVRLLVSLPLVILSALLLEKYLLRYRYSLPAVK